MVSKWDIYFCDLNPIIGSEQRGLRPVLIISRDAINHHLQVSTVLPLSSVKEGSKVYLSEVFLPIKSTGLPKDSVAMLQQIRTISHQRFLKKAGILEDALLRNQIEEAIRAYFEV